jgi:hypothetical protein
MNHKALFPTALASVALATSFSLVAAASEPATAKDLPALTAAYMLRGYFYAGSHIRDRDALGGFGSSDNYPRRLDRRVPKNAISLVALPEEITAFDSEHRGFVVILANTTRRRVAFGASDSRLSIVREAVTSDGQWKPIEYLPSSWCGNSYHKVILAPGQYWSFAAPAYEGSINTRMRFALQVGPKQPPLYSNEFPGSVNEEQFLVQQGHTPTDLMDPYTN